jgi:phospholipase/carboxylesterase
MDHAWALRPTISRRRFCTVAGGTIASLALNSACTRSAVSLLARNGRFTARPREGVKTQATGQISLGLDRERDTLLYVPPSAAQSAVPLLVLLHGATQEPETMFWYLGKTHEEAGVAVLAPSARSTTWDAMGGGSFGEDVEHLNRVLERVFETVSIDVAHLALAGFSDGASYALSLGLINGDLFPNIVAFSPGFVIGGNALGKPRIFISHGTHDHILPIDRCGRRVAASLIARGYEVTFREFDGDHEIPADIAREGLKWMTGK